MEYDYFKDHIRRHASIYACTYCGRRSRKRAIAVPIDEIIDRVREAVHAEYNDAADEPVPYESAEGGYQLRTMSTYELMDEIGFYAGNDVLQDEIMDALPDYAWIRRAPLSLSKDEALISGWEEFSRIVKHRVRYLLFPSEERSLFSDAVAPPVMLDALGSQINDLDLINTVPAGIALYRVRLHPPGTSYTTIGELGPPPIDATRYSNRMSPAGVSMFYAALDPKTALAETLVRRKRRPTLVTTAQFETTEPIRVLDLVNLASIPDFFADEEERWKRAGLIFLHDFRADFTRPVPKDGREHVEYVPTQVVTEFLRYKFRDAADRPLQGVVYPSARRKRGIACVLFFSHEDCTGNWEFGKPLSPPFRLLGTSSRPL